MSKPLVGVFIVLLLALVISSPCGCSDDARLAQMAERAAQRQAEQNREMAKVTRESAEATKRLVEADAQSRTELVALQQDLRADQASVNERRDQLEKERKDIAAQRVRESLLAPVVAWILPFAICGLALVTCCVLLFGLRRETDDEAAISDLLVEELTSERPTLLAGPATHVAIQDHSRSADTDAGTADQP